MPHDFKKLSNKEGVFSIRIPNLYLRTQMYSFSYQISLGSTAPEDFCDKLTKARALAVLSKAFYTDDIIVSRRAYQALVPAEFNV
jgi:hypothetical protein